MFVAIVIVFLALLPKVKESYNKRRNEIAMHWLNLSAIKPYKNK
jgi:hypothetical protein